ncbi:type II CRISPR RNA-guided endonuclease Cas9 [bacterium]|nr:type II CRISPR RNA-guided endonuclease Cas9 [bacterium]
MKYALGLDVGSSSIGWAVVSEESDGEASILWAGVRVFPEGVGREKGRETSKMAERRLKRQMRRQVARRVGRRAATLRALVDAGFANDMEAIRNVPLGEADPWELRAAALVGPLPPLHVARAIHHLGQRRGFRSGRKGGAKEKDPDQAKEAKVLEARLQALEKALLEKGAPTVGSLMASRPAHLPRRARALTCDIFPAHARRDQISAEFAAIWKAQAPHHPSIMTEEARAAIHHAIFFQRPLKSTDDKIGACELEPDEKRCRKGSWYHQEFRMLQDVSHLRIRDLQALSDEELSPDQRQDLLATLRQKGKLTAKQLAKLLRIAPHQEFSFARQKQTEIKANPVDRLLSGIFEDYDDRADWYRDLVWEAALGKDADEFIEWARAEGIAEDSARNLAVEAEELPDGYSNLSAKTIRAIIPHLTNGLTYDKARNAAGYSEVQYARGGQCALLPEAPSHLNNAVVTRALAEVRRVVNALIAHYGCKPERINIEMARETKGSMEERNDQLSKNRRREAEKIALREKLKAEFHLAEPRSNDLLKYELWLEFGGICPYTLKAIPPHLIFTDEIQIEHILPFSRTLDDSRGNKALCYRSANLEKGDRLPIEYFRSRGGDYLEQVKAHLDRLRSEQVEKKGASGYLCYSKFLRFFKEDLGDLDSRIARQLNDTRYMAKEIRRYLTNILPLRAVNATRGEVTAELRYRWGLNSILSPDGSETKNRADHRHHAIDAVVIALTTPRHLQLLSRREDFRNRTSGQPKGFPQPAPGFREAVAKVIDKILVTYRAVRHVRGGLHEETNYGRDASLAPDQFHSRRAVTDLFKAGAAKVDDALAEVKDPILRQQLASQIRERGLEQCLQQGFFRPNRNDPNRPIPIRRVRVVRTLNSMIPLRDHRTGQTTKYVKPGSNHHVSFFEFKDKKGRLAREAVPMTMFEAAARAAENRSRARSAEPLVPIIRREHPSRPDAKFLFSLSRDELVRLTKGEHHDVLARVISLSASAKPNGDYGIDMELALHTRADVRERADRIRITNLDPAKLQIRKVHLDVLGREYPAND